MKSAVQIVFISLLMASTLISCAHKGLNRTLRDQSLDALRHESLSRYSEKELIKLDGLAKNIALCHQESYNEAFTLFKEALDRNRKNPVYWNHLGTCYYLKGEYPKSLIYLEISLNLTKELKGRKGKDKSLAGAIHNNIGLNHLKQGNFQEAKYEFKKALDLDANAMTPKYNLAQLYLSKGLYNKAQGLLLQLNRNNRKDVDINYSLGHLHLMKNDYSTALKYFKEIPAGYVQRDDVALNLATTYYLMGEHKLALKALDAAHMKVPRFTLAQTELKKRIERNEKDRQ